MLFNALFLQRTLRFPISSRNAWAGIRSSSQAITGLRHVGHRPFVLCLDCLIHSEQNACPHLINFGSSKISRQIGQIKDLSGLVMKMAVAIPISSCVV
mmetsp:Transcript_23890/g.27203  ORF Transcript_23890/g.27203 Transcript_23890/m.27203 type:complete len:98 (+) Transcript_23890:309-602(+)